MFSRPINPAAVAAVAAIAGAALGEPIAAVARSEPRPDWRGRNTGNGAGSRRRAAREAQRAAFLDALFASTPKQRKA